MTITRGGRGNIRSSTGHMAKPCPSGLSGPPLAPPKSRDQTPGTTRRGRRRRGRDAARKATLGLRVWTRGPAPMVGHRPRRPPAGGHQTYDHATPQYSAEEALPHATLNTHIENRETRTEQRKAVEETPQEMQSSPGRLSVRRRGYIPLHEHTLAKHMNTHTHAHTHTLTGGGKWAREHTKSVLITSKGLPTY